MTGTVYFPLRRSAQRVTSSCGQPEIRRRSRAILRQAMHELDPGLALANVATGDELSSNALAAPRYLSVLVAMFALAALVLSIVGIYGVMAHFVQQHTREIGIRLALGGDPSTMRRMVVWQGLRLVVVVSIFGIGAAMLGRSRLIGTLLYGVSPTDVRTMIADSRRACRRGGYSLPGAGAPGCATRSCRDPARELIAIAVARPAWMCGRAFPPSRATRSGALGRRLRGPL